MSDTDTEALPDQDTFGHRYIISNSDLAKYGCPHCNYRSGSMPISCGGAGGWICGDCDQGTTILHDHLTEVPASWMNEKGKPVEPHPNPKPARGREDKPPEGGGEYFGSRGVGSDMAPGCFACGGEPGGYSNISAFVDCKDSGERVVAMFEQGAWLDYRTSEPDRVQVKIGACEEHLPCLRKLHDITRAADGIIKPEMIADSKN